MRTETEGISAAGPIESGTTVLAPACTIAAGGFTSISNVTYTGSGGITSSGATTKIGYATGAGGTVTQGTSKSTGVTLSKPTGQITMHNASLNDNTNVTFTVTNTVVEAADTVTVVHSSAGTLGSYIVQAHTIASGSFKIMVRNVSGGALGEAIVLSFTVHKGASS